VFLRVLRGISIQKPAAERSVEKGEGWRMDDGGVGPWREIFLWPDLLGFTRIYPDLAGFLTG